MSLPLPRTHLKNFCNLYVFYLEVKAVLDLKDLFLDNLNRSSVHPQVNHVLRPSQSQVQAVVDLKDLFPNDLNR